jgi:hypothetical protein
MRATSATSRCGSRRITEPVGHASTQAGAAKPRHRSHFTAISADNTSAGATVVGDEAGCVDACFADDLGCDGASFADGAGCDGRSAIWMFSHGHAFAQFPQPVHSDGRMNTSPSGSRPIAPVGQSIMQAA